MSEVISLPKGGGATAPADGIVSTRRPNGSGWQSLLADSNGQLVQPVGSWELALAPSAKELLVAGKIEDIVLIISYAGQTPAWPK